MKTTDNSKITLRSTTHTAHVVVRPSLFRAGSAAQANEFQTSMQKNRASRPSSAANGHPETKPDSRTWKTGAPLEDQPPAWIAIEPDGDGGRQSVLQRHLDDGPDTPDSRVASERSRFAGQTAATHATSVANETLVSSLAEKLDTSSAASGQFELLLPSGHGIGVHYEVTPELTQVLLRARSALLSQQLKQCTDGISTALSQRSGRSVQVTAI